MRLARLAPSVLCIAACSTAAPAPSSRPPVRSTAAPAAADDIVFTGMCDASGAVPLSDELFAVADDEDNVLRVYDANRGGAPLAASDISPALPIDRAVGHGRKAGRRAREIDIEAATRLGDVALWITSHGRSSSGKERPERLFLFGTTAPRTAAAIDIVGTPYSSLVDDLTADDRFAAFHLDEAAQRAPKDPGGLNIEGLTARPDGAVLIGFRNPLPEGRALLVPLLNPLDVIAQRPARLGDPILLDLSGLGVRSLSWWRGRYLIAAGPVGSEGGFRLFAWSGEGAPAPLDGVDLGALHPEGFFTPDRLDRILVLSDDGSEPIDGVACKRLDDGRRKRFRGRWLKIETAIVTADASPGAE